MRSMISRGIVSSTAVLDPRRYEDGSQEQARMVAVPALQGTMVLRRTADAVLIAERQTERGTAYGYFYLFHVDGGVRGFLEMARLPGDGRLEVPHLDALGAVIRDRQAELVVAGRIPGSTLQALETDAACRVRSFVEERGMRSARASGRPRSLLGSFMARTSPAELVSELATLGDAVILDTRVLMAARAGSAEASAWPPAEERFASDFGDAARLRTPWLRELTGAAAAARAAPPAAAPRPVRTVRRAGATAMGLSWARDRDRDRP